MNKSENINELAKALVEVQANIKPAKFDSVNPFYKSKYASLGSVIEAAKILAEHGLSYSQLPVSEGWYVGIENILMHTSGQWISEKFLMPLDMESKNPIQESGKALTYARRYGLASMLGIYSDEDMDATKEGTAGKISKNIEKKNLIPEGRPYPPTKLKEKLAETADKLKRGVSAKQIGLIAMLLREHVEGDEVVRHALQKYLVGFESLKDADAKMALAVLRWLDPSQDSGGKYVLPAVVKAELKMVLAIVEVSKSI